jgi:hypothetical protein
MLRTSPSALRPWTVIAAALVLAACDSSSGGVCDLGYRCADFYAEVDCHSGEWYSGASCEALGYKASCDDGTDFKCRSSLPSAPSQSMTSGGGGDSSAAGSSGWSAAGSSGWSAAGSSGSSTAGSSGGSSGGAGRTPPAVAGGSSSAPQYCRRDVVFTAFGQGPLHECRQLLGTLAPCKSDDEYKPGPCSLVGVLVCGNFHVGSELRDRRIWYVDSDCDADCQHLFESGLRQAGFKTAYGYCP